MGMATIAKHAAPEWAKELSRPVFRSIGRASAPLRPLPEFMIIGTKRGGTQSMYQYLLKHPAILPMWPGVENAKKTHFFDQNFHRGELWYRAHFPTVMQRRRVQESYGAAPVSGEAAPYYMFHPLVLERVQATIPDVKVIVLLRNPVNRVWSHYHERVNAGTETLPFREALAAEEARLEGEVERMHREPTYYSERHDFSSYLSRGRYLEHLAPWLDAFPADQVHIIKSEEMYSDPAGTLSRTHEFLGLPAEPPEPHRYNQIPAEKLDDDTRAWLTEYYRPHVQALERRLGRSFGWPGLSLAQPA